jgi:hypothetical protein
VRAEFLSSLLKIKNPLTFCASGLRLTPEKLWVVLFSRPLAQYCKRKRAMVMMCQCAGHDQTPRIYRPGGSCQSNFFPRVLQMARRKVSINGYDDVFVAADHPQ